MTGVQTCALPISFEPLIPGVRFGEYNDVAGLDTLLDEQVCAVIVECVQGEAGAVPGTSAFLEAVRARCTAVGALLVIDEVQTGMGRTGRVLAQHHFGVKGDLTVMSKALGAGLPIGAVLMTADVAQHLAPGMHGCTFGGNAVCAAAAVLAYAWYTLDPRTIALHGTASLVLTVPFVLYGMGRYLWLLYRQGRGEDPSSELLRDPHLIAAVTGWLVVAAILLR